MPLLRVKLLVEWLPVLLELELDPEACNPACPPPPPLACAPTDAAQSTAKTIAVFLMFFSSPEMGPREFATVDAMCLAGLTSRLAKYCLLWRLHLAWSALHQPAEPSRALLNPSQCARFDGNHGYLAGYPRAGFVQHGQRIEVSARLVHLSTNASGR